MKKLATMHVPGGRLEEAQIEIVNEEDEREDEHDDEKLLDFLRFVFPCLISKGKDHPGRIQLDGGNLLLLLTTETHVHQDLAIKMLVKNS